MIFTLNNDELLDLAAEFIEQARCVYYMIDSNIDSSVGDVVAIVPADDKVIFTVHPEDEEDLIREIKSRNLEPRKVSIEEFFAWGQRGREF